MQMCNVNVYRKSHRGYVCICFVRLYTACLNLENLKKMDDKTPTAAEQGTKTFSILEKFRQLKKEKDQVPTTTVEEPAQAQDTAAATVFQASPSPTTSSNGHFGRGGYRGRGFGRFGRGKRPYFDNSSERPSKRIAGDQWRGQREADVGITEFIRSGPGFPVILKHRYTDFHVHEIDLDGNVVKLTSLKIPKDKTEDPEVPTTEENPNILSVEQWNALREIVEKQLPETVEKDVTDLSKEERQRIHKAVKMRFGVHVFSNTLNVDDKKIMKIGYGLGQKPGPRWKDGRPEYLHFVLHKENSDTSEAIGLIGKYIKVKNGKFGYAGTKDKRAVTTQQMCLRRVEMERFTNCQWRAITVGNFRYKWSNLRLGDLSGNRFKLVLRNVKASQEVIEEAIENLKNVGFINYFGMQRFGQSALVPTYLVGKAILKGDWKLATELILKPRPGEASFWDVKEAREVWWEKRDAAEALKCLGRKEKSIEGKILSALKKLGPNAYQNAFDTLPHYTVTLYLHSYQSLVWNKVVSRRVKQFGLKVLPGDLARTSDSDDWDREMLQPDTAADSDASEDEQEEYRGKIQVRVLSAEEAATTSIYDVVYPLPGDDIRFPENEIAGWYTELLEADGHSLADFSTVNKKYGMYGTYRKMLETAQDLNWHTQQYSEPDEDLLISDLDILKGKSPPVSKPDGPYKAIIVEFNLKTCSYATMAIRELAKCETSVVAQAKLTCEAKEEDLEAKKLKAEKMELETESEKGKISRTGRDSDFSNSNEVKNGESQTVVEGETTSIELGVGGKTTDVEMEVESEENLNCDTLNGSGLKRRAEEQPTRDSDVEGGTNPTNEPLLDKSNKHLDS